MEKALFEKLVNAGYRKPVNFAGRTFMVWDQNFSKTKRGFNFKITNCWLLEFESLEQANKFKGFFKGYKVLSEKHVFENTTGNITSPRAAGHAMLKKVCEEYNVKITIEDYELAMPCYEAMAK